MPVGLSHPSNPVRGDVKYKKTLQWNKITLNLGLIKRPDPTFIWSLFNNSTIQIFTIQKYVDQEANQLHNQIYKRETIHTRKKSAI